MHQRTDHRAAQLSSRSAADRQRPKSASVASPLADRRTTSRQLAQLAALANPAPPTQLRTASAAPNVRGTKRASNPPGGPVVQRMTLPEYHNWIKAHGGDSVSDLLDRGWDSFRGDGEEKEEKEGKRSDSKYSSVSSGASGGAASASAAAAPMPVHRNDPRMKWRHERGLEIIQALGRVDYAAFLGDRKLQQSVQMIIGRVGRGEPLLEPPSATEAVRTNANLYRGTTLDSSTGLPFVGNAGSRHGSPTTPSALIAALFATKSATENRSAGVVIYGGARNVARHGFVAPDVMAGQEQEITVNADPTTTNAALGTQLALADFRQALALVGEVVPPALQAGQDFDNRLMRAARSRLSPAMDARLTEILSNPGAMIPAWTRLDAAFKAAEVQLAGKVGVMERKKKANDVSAAEQEAAELRRLSTAFKQAPSLATATAALRAIEAGIALFDAALAAATPLASQSAAAAPADEEELNLFD